MTELQGPRARAGGALPVRRQPAEGRAGEVAQDAAADPDLRRADARHRRRRQGRHPRPDPQAREGGRRRADDLLRAAGADRHERPHPRHARGPARRRAAGGRERAGDHGARDRDTWRRRHDRAELPRGAHGADARSRAQARRRLARRRARLAAGAGLRRAAGHRDHLLDRRHDRRRDVPHDRATS